tara:strand:+ start:85 stop:879 length:795 start_codon:yes stop_codon:yes gene_type:complete
MGAHKKLVIVFDLDQTIGYFTQFAIFMEGLESYIKRKLKRDELFKLFDLYPQVFRPKMMELFKYLERIKKKNKWLKVMIYTNNNGPKSWTYDIKHYIEKKLNYKLFDKIITAWKVNGKIYEKCRSGHEKSYKDLKNCAKFIKKQDKIYFLDDQPHPYMKHENITYNHLTGYKYDILFEKMCNSFLKSKLSKILPKQHDNFKKFIVAFSKTDPLGFRYVEKSYKSVLSIGNEKLIPKIKKFIHKNRPRLSRRKQKTIKNKTRKKI